MLLLTTQDSSLMFRFQIQAQNKQVKKRYLVVLSVKRGGLIQKGKRTQNDTQVWLRLRWEHLGLDRQLQRQQTLIILIIIMSRLEPLNMFLKQYIHLSLFIFYYVYYKFENGPLVLLSTLYPTSASATESPVSQEDSNPESRIVFLLCHPYETHTEQTCQNVVNV